MSNSSVAPWMAKAQDPEQQERLAADPNCPPEVLLWLAQNMENPPYSGIFENPSLPAEAIEYLLKHSDADYKKGELMDLPNFQESFMDMLVVHKEECVRFDAAKRATPKYLAQLAKDPDWGVRRGVAVNPNTPVEILLELIHDKHSDVVRGVIDGPKYYGSADHVHMYPEIWDELLSAKPINSDVEKKVAESVPAEFIHRAKNWVSVKYAHHFLKNIFMPKEWVDEFLNEPKLSHDILLPLIVGHGFMKDEYIPLIIKSKDQNLREHLANQRGLSKEAQRALTKDKSARVREALAVNPDADPEILMDLVNDKSVSVLTALTKPNYWDYEVGQLVPYSGREQIYEAVKKSSAKVKQESKTKTVEGRSEALQSEVIDLERYQELLGDKSIGIQVAATLRAAELGLISFVEAATFITKNSPSSTAPKNRWIEARMGAFESQGNAEYLDLVLELRGDQVLADKIHSAPEAFTPELVLKISKAHLPITNWTIILRYDLTPELLDELAETPSWSYETYGASPTSLEFGQWKTETTSGYRVVSYPQAVVAMHPLSRSETLEKLKKSRSQYVRGVLLNRPDFATPEDFKKAAKDKDSYVRCIVAAHEKVPLEILEILAGDKDDQVRNLAAANPLATPEIKAIAALLA